MAKYQEAGRWVLLLALIYVFASSIQVTDSAPAAGWYECISFIEHGTLYGNQPYCGQGPVIFYYGFIITKIFGYDMLSVFMLVGTLASDVVVLYLIYLILKSKKLLDYATLGIAFMFLLHNSVNHAESAFSMAFFFMGFYTLFHTKRNRRELESGTLFAISIFSKYTVVFQFAIVLLYYAYTKGFFKLKDKSSIAWKMAGVMRILLPTMLLTIALLLGYSSNFIMHTIMAHMVMPRYTYPQTLLAMLNLDAHFLALYVMIISFAYLIYKRKFVKTELLYPLIPLISLPLIMFSLSHGSGAPTNAAYYGIVGYPFIILAVLRIKEKLIFALLFVVLLIYPTVASTQLDSIMRSSLEKSQKDFIEYVNWGLHYIPQQNGKVLTEGAPGTEKIFEEYKTPVDPRSVDLVHGEAGYSSHEDPYYGPRLRSIMNISNDFSTSSEELSSKEKVLGERIMNGTYSLIMFGSAGWAEVTRVLSYYPQHRKYYCVVNVPDMGFLGAGRFYTVLLFRNPADCQRMMNDVYAYYKQNFNEICRRSRIAAKYASEVMSMNKMDLGMTCDNGGYEERIYYVPIKNIQLIDVVFILLLCCFVYLSYK